jgi:hypothetical protein
MNAYRKLLALLASIIVTATLSAAPFAVTHAYGDPCTATRSVGVDIVERTTTAGAFLGKSVVQTFFAEDTLIGAITMWRANSQPVNGIRLEIDETDSTGMPLTDRPLLVWPVVLTMPADSTADSTSPTEYRYEFNPPFAVPRRDTFAVNFISDPCIDIFDLHVAKDTPSVGGSLWLTSRFGCGRRTFPIHHPELDLCLKVEFCDTVTPTRPFTWGRLKLRYR